MEKVARQSDSNCQGPPPRLLIPPFPISRQQIHTLQENILELKIHLHGKMRSLAPAITSTLSKSVTKSGGAAMDNASKQNIWARETELILAPMDPFQFDRLDLL